LEKPLPAYRGDEPFVFVCYAHDDSAEVYPELHWLQEQGVKLWYDEGISPGSVWRGEIAEAIERAAWVLYYVSSGSVASSHCDREINYALDHDLPVLPIYLESVELPADQRIGLSRVQAMHRHETAEEDHRARLIGLLRDDSEAETAVGPDITLRRSVPDATRRFPVWTIAAVVAVALVVAVAVVQLDDVDPNARADPARLAFPMPEGPSLVVLPFTNVGGSPNQDLFADGLTDDLITDLSQLTGLFVIARNTAFSYKGRDVEVRRVAEELGIRYVLEGRVRALSDDVRRVNAQLIDSTTGGTIWAQRFDVPVVDVFAFQEEVTTTIAEALGVGSAVDAGAVVGRYETENREAHEAFLAGWTDYRANTPEHYAAAIPHFERAIALDPEYGRAHAGLAAVYQASLSKDFTSGLGEWTRALGMRPDDILLEVGDHLAKAQLSTSPLSHQVESQLLLFQGRFADAIDEAERAIALDGNDPLGYEALAVAKIMAGEVDAGTEAIQWAMRLDPQNPQAYLFWEGLAQFGARDFDAALATLERARDLNPRDDRVLIVLASTYGHLGREEASATIDALNALREARKDELERAPPRGIRLGIDVFLPGEYSLSDVDLWPFKTTPDRERLREGLQVAGLPKHAPGAESVLAVDGAMTVDAAQTKALYDRGVAVVDVRATVDRNIGFIVGAVHLELFEEFSEDALLQVVDKDDGVIIYCEGPKCLRSSEACEKAVAWGFSAVYYFRDGFPAWRAAGYPTDALTD